MLLFGFYFVGKAVKKGFDSIWWGEGAWESAEKLKGASGFFV